jgi:hypothetical protein
VYDNAPILDAEVDAEGESSNNATSDWWRNNLIEVGAFLDPFQGFLYAIQILFSKAVALAFIPSYGAQ